MIPTQHESQLNTYLCRVPLPIQVQGYHEMHMPSRNRGLRLSQMLMYYRLTFAIPFDDGPIRERHLAREDWPRNSGKIVLIWSIKYVFESAEPDYTDRLLQLIRHVFKFGPHPENLYEPSFWRSIMSEQNRHLITKCLGFGVYPVLQTSHAT